MEVPGLRKKKGETGRGLHSVALKDSVLSCHIYTMEAMHILGRVSASRCIIVSVDQMRARIKMPIFRRVIHEHGGGVRLYGVWEVCRLTDYFIPLRSGIRFCVVRREAKVGKEGGCVVSEWRRERRWERGRGGKRT